MYKFGIHSLLVVTLLLSKSFVQSADLQEQYQILTSFDFVNRFVSSTSFQLINYFFLKIGKFLHFDGRSRFMTGQTGA